MESACSLFLSLCTGLLLINGPLWKLQRRFSLKVFKNLGVATPAMERHIRVSPRGSSHQLCRSASNQLIVHVFDFQPQLQHFDAGRSQKLARLLIFRPKLKGTRRSKLIWNSSLWHLSESAFSFGTLNPHIDDFSGAHIDPTVCETYTKPRICYGGQRCPHVRIAHMTC